MKKLVLALLLPYTAFAQGTVPTFPGEVITTTISGINGSSVAANPWTSSIDVHLANHVVWTGNIMTPGTITKLSMTCLQSPDNGATWGPIPVCDDSAPPALACNTRVWEWLKIQGLQFTFYVPVNASRIKCQFSGTLPGSATIKVAGYKAAL